MFQKLWSASDGFTQLDFYLITGDQVSKKGGMTGGFYDYRRSKLKYMNIVVQNTKSINMKEKELEEVRNMLQDILLTYAFIFSCVGSILVFVCVSFPNTYTHKKSLLHCYVLHTSFDEFRCIIDVRIMVK